MDTNIISRIREKVQDTIRAMDPEAYIDLEGWDIREDGAYYTRTAEDELFTIDGGDGVTIDLNLTVTVTARLRIEDYNHDDGWTLLAYEDAACTAEVAGIEVYGGEIPRDIADSIVGMAA